MIHKYIFNFIEIRRVHFFLQPFKLREKFSFFDLNNA